MKPNSVFASLLPACCIALVFTFAPVESTHTVGLIGAEPLCAQESPADRCSQAWEDIVNAHDRHCPAGTQAHCEVVCDAETGDLGRSYCICAQGIQ